MVPFVQKYYKQLVLVVAAGFMATMAMMSLSAQAAVTAWDQGFETDTAGWLDETSTWDGSIVREASNSYGVASAEGDWHARMIQDESHDTGPFSRFDMYRDTAWPGTWTAEIDVYLDTEWELGSGFDYSVASSNQSGAHLRDFIFHVAKDTSTEQLIVAGSNNTNFNVREDLDTLANHEVVSVSGWYTLQHVFRDNGGVLAVDLNLLDDGGNVLFTETRSTPADDIATVVGGNRYSWFTVIDVDGGVAADNHQLILNDAIYQPTGEITSPDEDEVVSGELVLGATYDDGDEDNDDAVQWAVRAGTCDAGIGTVAGNVDGFSDASTWDGAIFAATLDTTSWADGEYCFVFNPTDDAGENDVRETVEFNVRNNVYGKEQCKEGGWTLGLADSDREFRNQGDCVSHFASEKQRTENPDGQAVAPATTNARRR